MLFDAFAAARIFGPAARGRAMPPLPTPPALPPPPTKLLRALLQGAAGAGSPGGASGSPRGEDAKDRGGDGGGGSQSAPVKPAPRCRGGGNKDLGLTLGLTAGDGAPLLALQEGKATEAVLATLAELELSNRRYGGSSTAALVAFSATAASLWRPVSTGRPVVSSPETNTAQSLPYFLDFRSRTLALT